MTFSPFRALSRSHFHVTLSVLNLPNYLARTPFQGPEGFSVMFAIFTFKTQDFMILNLCCKWTLRSWSVTWYKNARLEIKERTGTITIINAVTSLFVLFPYILKGVVLYHVTDQLQRVHLANLVRRTFSKKVMGTRLPIWLVLFVFSLRPSY